MLGRYSLVLVLVVALASAENIAKVDGDVKIAGLFEIENRKGDNCGPINTDSVMVLEATRWYIEQLNKHNALPFKLGKFTVSAVSAHSSLTFLLHGTSHVSS